MQSSGLNNPCPVCGRTKDGDCRITTDGLVLCHTHQGQDAKPGDPSPNGCYRFLKTSTGAQGSGVWKPIEQWVHSPGRGQKKQPARLTTTSNSAMAMPTPLALPADVSAIKLARLPAPVRQPPDHWPDGQQLDYSPTQRVVLNVSDGNKQHRPWHRPAAGDPWTLKAGPDPWPFWKQDEAITHGLGKWVFEAEGEKCSAWIRAAGYVAISHPGHNHKGEANQARYKALQQAGVLGVVYLADHDDTGQKKANKCLSASNAVGLKLLVVYAADVWPDLPEGGSIDDASGSPDERVQQLIKALPDALKIANNNPEEPAADRPFRQLIRSTLQAVRDNDLDSQMELRAVLGHRFRLDHRQVTAALFRLLVEQSAGDSAPADFSDQSLDLDQVEGMDELLPGFIPANDQALIYGKAGAGKTMACLAAAFALIDGAGFLDHDAKANPGKALFIASDSGPSPLKAALSDLALGDHPGVRSGPDQRFFVWASDAKQGLPTWTASISHWIQLFDFIQDKGIDLVLIDSAKAVCSQADPVVNYADNESVSAMLTFVKAVICRHAAVAWISHDGTVKGSHAGAKAWAEIPSVVHRIEQQPDEQSPPGRLWTVVKNRMGPERQFSYCLDPGGALEVCKGVEVVRDARQAILTVLTEAVGRGHSSLSRQGLLDEIGQRFRFSKGTIDNSLSQMARAKHPDICRVKSPRGHYKLSPACLQRLNRDSNQGKPKSQESELPFKGAHKKMNEHDKKQVSDLDLLTSLQVHSLTQVNSETSSSSSHVKTHVNSEKTCAEQTSSHVHSRDRGIYREPEKSEAVSDSSQEPSHSMAEQSQAGASADLAEEAAVAPPPADLLVDQGPLPADQGQTGPSADPATASVLADSGLPQEVGTGRNTPEGLSSADASAVPPADPAACPKESSPSGFPPQDQVQQQSKPIQNSSSMPNQNDRGFLAPADRLAAHRERLKANPIQCGSLALGDHFNDLLSQKTLLHTASELALDEDQEQQRDAMETAGHPQLSEEDWQLQDDLDKRWIELLGNGSLQLDMQDLPAAEPTPPSFVLRLPETDEWLPPHKRRAIDLQRQFPCLSAAALINKLYITTPFFSSGAALKAYLDSPEASAWSNSPWRAAGEPSQGNREDA